ncbi:LLM class flavin-dependent oxidoreductase [Pseudoalteromonas sp. B62]
MYSAFVNGKANPLPALELQYVDYANWQRKRLVGDELVKGLGYWSQHLAGMPPVHSLPLDYPRPKQQSFVGITQKRPLNPELGRSIQALCQSKDVTLFMLLQSAFSVLIGRYSNETDIVIGTPTAGRDHQDLEQMIGFFVNTLVLRSDLEGNPSFTELLAENKTRLLDAYTYQYIPFEMLVEELKPERSMSYGPLNQIVFAVQNFEHGELDMSGVTTRAYENDDKQLSPDFELGLHVNFDGDNLIFDWSCNTAVFNEQTLERFGNSMEILLQGIVANPDTNIQSLPVLSEQERNTLIDELNDTAVEYPKELCIHEVFEAQVVLNPQAIAVVYENNSLSYEQLNLQANQLAHYLKVLGVKSGHLVGLCIERSLDMVIGLLAILKAGGAYVPLDPSYPVDRLNHMLSDSNAQLLLTQRNSFTQSSFAETMQKVYIDDRSEWTNEAITNMDKDDIGLTSSDLAYMIYTSGSSGKPKGVMIEHHNVLNLFTGLDKQFGTSQGQDHWLAVTSISFDISVLELFWTLGNGHKVVVQPDRPVPVENTKALDFSLFYFAAEESNQSVNKYHLLFEGAKFADTHDMAAIWVPERHFASFGDPFPNPSVAAAAVAAITNNIAIRSGSVVLPLHDPIRVAEEWSMVDNISNGRVELSLASGWHPNDFVLAPDDYHTRHQKLQTNTEVLKEFWKGAPMLRTNGIGKEVEIYLHPQPVQKTLPTWITAGGNPETFRNAGLTGAHLLTHLLSQGKETLGKNIKVYQDALVEAGYRVEDFKVAVMLHTFVGENIDEVKAIVEKPFKNYLRQSINLLRPLAEQAGLDLYNDVDALLDMGFERHFQTSGLMGTPQSCMSQIQELQEIGVTELACLIDFGVDHQLSIDHLPQLHQLQQNVRQLAGQQQLLARRLENHWSPAQLMTEHQITHMQCTPTFAHEMVMETDGQSALGQLKHLCIGGEALSPELASQVLSHMQGQVFNMYGPTETTVWSAISDVTLTSVDLGAPIANTQFYVVDQYQQLVPRGTVGELFIGGDGVTRGYYQREELTADKFINNPFTAHDDVIGRIYKTGDLVRWLPDGGLQYFGRIDEQVKVRGFRIELGEIESALLSYKKVTEAVVIAWGEPKRLLAYVVTESGVNIDEDLLREHIKTSLPEYMIPASFVQLDGLPLTPNGKINRNALPEPDSQILSESTYVAPVTDIERQLCEIWQTELGIEQVGVTDNFFSIGGDSILSIRMIASCNRNSLGLATRQLFEHQTIRELALQVVGSNISIVAPQTPSEAGQALLPVQHWYLESGDAVDRSHYNHALLLKAPKKFNKALLKQLVTALYQRHDALRLRFTQEQDQWQANYQIFDNAMVAASVVVEDLDGLSAEQQTQALETRGEAIQASLSITDGPLFKAVLFTSMQGEQRLLLVLHHLVVDGISWRILLTDLKLGYEQLTSGKPVKLTAKTSSLQQWGKFLLEHAATDAVQQERDYWLEQLSIAVAPLPVGHGEVVDNTVATTGQVSFTLDAEKTTSLLTDSNKPYRTEINDLLLTALLSGINDWSGESAARVDMEGHGREALNEIIDHSDTLGWFTSIYPLTLHSEKGVDIAQRIMAVKEQTRQVPNKGIGFGLLKFLVRDEGINNQCHGNESPIIFNYIGQVDQAMGTDSIFSIADESAGNIISVKRQREHQLSIVGSVLEGQLTIAIGYNSKQYDHQMMTDLVEGIKSGLEQIVEHCQSDEAGCYTPSDFPLAQINAQELQQWQVDHPTLEDVYVSTPMQQGLLFHSLMDKSAYITQLFLNVIGDLDIDAFSRAWQQVVNHYDVFRTVFVGEQMHQLVVANGSLDVTVKDLRDMDVTQQRKSFENYRRADKKQGFDITQLPLMRLSMFQLDDKTVRLLLSYHHAVMDAWSQAIVLKNVILCYEAIKAGRTEQLPTLVPYRGYVQWLNDQDKPAARVYWQQMLGDFESPTEIGIDQLKVESQDTGSGYTAVYLPEDKTAALQQLAKSTKTTLNTIIQGAWGYLLHRYSGEKTVVFGETTAGRPAKLADVGQIAGLFINTLPVRMDFDTETDINTWLQQLHKQGVERESFSYLPLLDIQRLSGVEKNVSLFNSLFAFNHFPIEELVDDGTGYNGLAFDDFADDEQTNYGLSFSVAVGPELEFSVDYKGADFSEETIMRLLGHMEVILDGILAGTDGKITDLPMLTNAEHQRYNQWNETKRGFDENACIHHLFEAQALSNPNAIAVVYEDEELTYGVLNEQANQVAYYLLDQQVKPDTLVGLCLDRSLDMLVGILGILKAGGHTCR